MSLARNRDFGGMQNFANIWGTVIEAEVNIKLRASQCAVCNLLFIAYIVQTN